MTKDLRYYIDSLQKHLPDQIVTINHEVSPIYETAALIQNLGGGIMGALGEFGRKNSPAVYFTKVQGYNVPLIANIFGSRKRIAFAIGCEENDIERRIIDAEKNKIQPRRVSSGPVKEVVLNGDEVDLAKLPISRHAEDDLGEHIGSGIAFIKDPENGDINMGIYRHMRQGKRQLGASFAPQNRSGHLLRMAEAKGQPLELAIVIGHHPALHVASQNYGVDDLALAGGLLGEAVDMVRCETVDLEVPADAEIVIEGKILPGVRQDDAPYGEYVGYYGDATIKRPVMEVTAITRRKDVIYHDIDNCGIEHPQLSTVGVGAKAYKRVKECVPQVLDVYVPVWSGHHLALVRMKKGYDGSGKNAAIAALTTPFIKIAVVVDEDIDIYDERAVLWAIVSRTDPDRSIFFIPEAYVSRLDPTSYSLRSRAEKGSVSTKMGIDATKPTDVEFPKVAMPPREVLEKVKPEGYLK